MTSERTEGAVQGYASIGAAVGGASCHICDQASRQKSGGDWASSPAYRLDWQPVEGKEEILLRVIPDRDELARRLLGAGRKYAPERDAVDELIQERAGDPDQLSTIVH